MRHIVRQPMMSIDTAVSEWIIRGLRLAISLLAPVGIDAQPATVSDSGTPHYRVPLEVPPGIASLVPRLALAYVAGGTDGPVGIGWALEGVSTVNRCANIQALDNSNVKGPVNGVDDALCLDGQRSILTNAFGVEVGTFPQPGSAAGLAAGYREYRTENDSFARIRAYGAIAGVVANGPVWFRV